jgi:hypothetical protein
MSGRSRLRDPAIQDQLGARRADRVAPLVIHHVFEGAWVLKPVSVRPFAAARMTIR